MVMIVGGGWGGGAILVHSLETMIQQISPAMVPSWIAAKGFDCLYHTIGRAASPDRGVRSYRKHDEGIRSSDRDARRTQRY
jgi:hypothetical protein